VTTTANHPPEPEVPRGFKPTQFGAFHKIDQNVSAWFYWKPPGVCVAKILLAGLNYFGWSAGAKHGPWQSAADAQSYLRACVTGAALPVERRESD
jgi:hypothetical protein